MVNSEKQSVVIGLLCDFVITEIMRPKMTYDISVLVNISKRCIHTCSGSKVSAGMNEKHGK